MVYSNNISASSTDMGAFALLLLPVLVVAHNFSTRLLPAQFGLPDASWTDMETKLAVKVQLYVLYLYKSVAMPCNFNSTVPDQSTAPMLCSPCWQQRRCTQPTSCGVAAAQSLQLPNQRGFKLSLGGFGRVDNVMKVAWLVPLVLYHILLSVCSYCILYSIVVAWEKQNTCTHGQGPVGTILLPISNKIHTQTACTCCYPVSAQV